MTSLPIGPFLASEDSAFFHLLDPFGQAPVCEVAMRATILAAVDRAHHLNRGHHMKQFLDTLIERVSVESLTADDAAHQLMQCARVWTADPLTLTV